MINGLKIININYLILFVVEEPKQRFFLLIFLLENHSISLSKLNIILLIQKFFYDHFVGISIYFYIFFKHRFREFIIYEVMELLASTCENFINCIQQKRMFSKETSKKILVLCRIFILK